MIFYESFKFQWALWIPNELFWNFFESTQFQIAQFWARFSDYLAVLRTNEFKRAFLSSLGSFLQLFTNF